MSQARGIRPDELGEWRPGWVHGSEGSGGKGGGVRLPRPGARHQVSGTRHQVPGFIVAPGIMHYCRVTGARQTSGFGGEGAGRGASSCISNMTRTPTCLRA